MEIARVSIAHGKQSIPRASCRAQKRVKNSNHAQSPDWTFLAQTGTYHARILKGNIPTFSQNGEVLLKKKFLSSSAIRNRCAYRTETNFHLKNPE